MTKLRSRLLVSLVLAAVTLVAVGVDVASARSAKGRSAPWLAATAAGRPSAGPCGGEPDPSGNGSPQPQVKPASLSGVPSTWLANLLIMWRTRSLSAQPHVRR
jgi:hypothetical protein